MFFLFPAHAQRIVTGKVIDAETGEPIPAAAVFIANTTVGTTTGNDGAFQLKLPGSGSYELVVSHVGYKAVSQKIEINRALVRLNIALYIHEMKDVIVSSQSNVTKKQRAQFWRTLLGTSPSSNTIYATNPQDVYLYYNAETGQLKAHCRVPIQIVNMATGYRISFMLESFLQGGGIIRWSGYAFFEELNTENRRQEDIWAMNREKVYQTSVRHFLRSLYHGNSLLQEGFLLRYIDLPELAMKGDGKVKFSRSISPVLDSRTFLYTDSIANSKVFKIPSGGDRGYLDTITGNFLPSTSNLLFTCYKKFVTPKDTLKHFNTFSTKYNVSSAGMYRNYIKLPDSTLRIFSDGTYMNRLRLDPYQSAPINGLNMALPIEYGLGSESDSIDQVTELSVSSAGYLEPLSFVPDLDSLMTHQYPEKIYLTTDRPYYAAGDTVWLNAWVLNGGTLEPTDKSRMLHVELIRPDGSILRYIVLDASQGLAPGQLVLPPGITGDAVFRIRAYTRWSLNFDESYRFEKTIPVVQFKDDVWQGPKITENKNYEWVRRPNGSYEWRRKTVTTGQKETSNELQLTWQVEDSLAARNLPPAADIDLQFLPEGGRWVAGFPCRMAFKAIASDGRGINVEGEIMDDLGKTITTFRSLHQGMGSVFLAPQPGRRYQARLFNGHTVDLPLPDTTGVVMTMQPARDDSLSVQLYFPPEMVRRNEVFNLVAQSRGVYAAAWEITATRPRIAMRLPVEQLQTGIARFTLFAKDGIPCNERLVFIDKKDEIQLKVEPLSSTLPLPHGEGAGGRGLLLQALDAYDNPVQGVFTVSVTDSLYGSHDTREPNLRSQMLLSSDLKGRVENPGWYFQDRDSTRLEALDLVMRTHGWSGYSWEDIRNADKTNMQYTPELDYRISGRVTNLRGAAAKDVSVTYLAQGATTLAGDTVTDAQGRFSFDHLLPLENTVVSLMAKHRKGKRNALGLGIELDKQPPTLSPPVAALPQSGSSTAWEEMLSMYRQQRQSDEYWLDSLLKRTDTKMIKEVTIEAKRPVKGSYNLNGPGQADHVLYEEDIARYDKYDRLLDILKAEFPQFKQENWELDEILWNENKEELRKEMGEKVSNREGAMNKINQPYSIWRYESRIVCFILNGRILPVGLPAEDTQYLRPHPAIEELRIIAINFWNIPATDITGIEILDSPEYLWAYADGMKNNPLTPLFSEDGFRIVDHPKRPLLVEVTTRSGRTYIERTPDIGLAKQPLQGFAIPRAFYVPKYYPDNIVDQAEYDVKPTLYWNSEVVTDREGKAEITFPVGLKPRGLQIRVEGTDLVGGIGSMMQGIRQN